MAGYYQSNHSFRKQREVEDVDPLSSMSNIGDIMLVFACGLMVALVMAWNVDLSQFTQVEMDEEIAQDDVTEMNEQLYGEGDSFVEMGTVYQDPATGKYYLVEDEGSSSGSAQGSNGSGSGGASGSEGTAQEGDSGSGGE